MIHRFSFLFIPRERERERERKEMQDKYSFVLCILLDFYPSPLLCKKATWNQTATTIVMQSTLKSNPRSLFIGIHDIIYVPIHGEKKILIKTLWQTDPKLIPNVNLYEYSDIFVGMNGDIYFQDADDVGQVKKWSIQLNQSIHVAQFDGHCHGLFIDENNTLYCSISSLNKVMKISLDDPNSEPIVVAGTGWQPFAPDKLKQPWGIYVDRQYNLYVADAEHNRIQRFEQGQRDGYTVFRDKIPSGLQLNFPTDLLIYEHNYTIIADNHHHRIIRSNGKRMVVYCWL